MLPLLEADKKGKLQAKTVLKELRERKRGQFNPGQLRTLQRRMRLWRALHGPPKEVFFEQEHPLGREAQFDFTDATPLGVTIAGVPLEHLIFEFILSASGWRYGEVAFGETFEAMSAGIQAAVWELGATTHVWRSDNLSAATHQIKKDQPGRKLTERYKQLTGHYGVESTRIKPRKSNENGVVEKGHHTLKSALEQALILRGTSEFPTLDAYRAFVRAVVADLNESCQELLAKERPHLKALPPAPILAFSDVPVTVHRSSCIRVGHNTYMVPSRLIGYEVTARVHPDEIEVIYRDQVVVRFERLRGEGKRRINYRYIIDSLVAKPGNRTEPLTLWTWSKVVRRIADAAELPRFSTHTLRHLCLTDLARAGWDLHEIATFAGHRSLSVTQQYVHLSGRDLAHKIERGMAQIHEWRVRQLAADGTPEATP